MPLSEEQINHIVNQVVDTANQRGTVSLPGEGQFSHTIATPTGEGISTPKDFVRSRRIMVHDALRFV